MFNFLKKLFKKKSKTKIVKMYEEPTFENVDAFLEGSEDLNLNTVTDSRSQNYFKEASKIIGTSENFPENYEETPEILALQSFISRTDHLEETIVEEEKEEDNSKVKL